jgi:hypothetical protein
VLTATLDNLGETNATRSVKGGNERTRIDQEGSFSSTTSRGCCPCDQRRRARNQQGHHLCDREAWPRNSRKPNANRDRFGRVGGIHSAVGARRNASLAIPGAVLSVIRRPHLSEGRDRVVAWRSSHRVGNCRSSQVRKAGRRVGLRNSRSRVGPVQPAWLCARQRVFCRIQGATS